MNWHSIARMKRKGIDVYVIILFVFFYVCYFYLRCFAESYALQMRVKRFPKTYAMYFHIAKIA